MTPRISGTLVAFALLLAAGAADAALTTGACLAQKRMAWITLRKCEGAEQVKQYKGKPGDLAKCQGAFQAKLAKISDRATKAAIACRYRDNGDSSVTDFDTGLMWATNNDVTVNYNARWSEVLSAFVSACNGDSNDGFSLESGCSIYHDWRVPNILELQAIVDPHASGCGVGSPCIDPIFGPTAANAYWSTTTYVSDPSLAWIVLFQSDIVGTTDKTAANYVRAVRTGF